mmetsp:Transcript_3282/g.4770  ORF Transcript_3282/g.4770 Transcript_3282/m.4770 type:complete len:124 (-) Transcript_3282:20-391(-)
MCFPTKKCDCVPPAPLAAPARTPFHPHFDSFVTKEDEFPKKFGNGSFDESSNTWLSKSGLLSSEASEMSCKSAETFPMDWHSYGGRKSFSIDSSTLSRLWRMSAASLAWQVGMRRDPIQEGPD